jgi:indolepyruvate ferredoxin oxidoreductase beta subunit
VRAIKKEKTMKPENFNIIINGVGGQGQLTLLRILTESAIKENLDLKWSELHGLSQRGGSVEVQLKIGKKIYSPLVVQADADFILSLEFQESLKVLYYVCSKTQFLINDFIIPVPGEKILERERILKSLEQFTKKIEILPASKICQEKFQKEVLAGVFLLGYALGKKFLPLKKESLIEGIKKVVPEKYQKENLEAFEAGFSFKF